ncbi:hypothetical protein [Neoaquamicrobium sediminum]|uniref:hypothetical protein n=1 Tax=Neoaquamicrobium sediminum TaxID=1849104 RepID=UPI0015648D78|nr:hypothetical protein [Mesorhizobium sediminum]NRC54691.1 hypothetical protein [Mesorhizobium sediminum]
MTPRQTDNRRETGKRIAKPVAPDDPSKDFSQDAAANRKPSGGNGLSEPVEETQAHTRKSEGVDGAADKRRNSDGKS